ETELALPLEVQRLLVGAPDPDHLVVQVAQRIGTQAEGRPGFGRQLAGRRKQRTNRVVGRRDLHYVRHRRTYRIPAYTADRRYATVNIRNLLHPGFHFRKRVVAAYQQHVDYRREAALRMWVAFIGTFLFLRFLTDVIRSHVLPARNLVTSGGLHIHHFVWGILILLIVGFLGITINSQRLHAWLAPAFGIGAALVIDEFALWLNLRDVYWAREGRISIDVAVVIAALLGVYCLDEPPGPYEAWRATLSLAGSQARAIQYSSGKLVVSGHAPAFDQAVALIEVVAKKVPPKHAAGPKAASSDPAAPPET